MWKTVKVFVLLLCLKSYLGQPQYGNDLGQQISQQVQESLKGLEHLGSDIQANVQEQLRAAGIQNLGSRISAQVQQQVAPLENLGSDIEAEVQRNLLPVYAMAIRKNMADGVGGTTIVTYTNGNSPRTFIVKDGKRSVCQGTITEPECDGTLEPFTITNKEDYCYTDSHTILYNNNICLAFGPVSVIANNNQFVCTSLNDDTPTLILTPIEYKNLCGNMTQGHVIYKYFANSNDPQAIPIPNSNPYVKCHNETPAVCEFEPDIFIPNGRGNSLYIRP